MPFPSGYAGYDSVTPANPAGTLTDFFYVLNANLLSAAWWANVKSDGGDVQAYNPSGDRLPVHLHNWNYGANTGLIFIGYTGTKLTTSETIRIYAGKPSESQPAAGDAYGQHAVFPSSVWGYWPDGGGNDLTSNARNFTMTGSPTTSSTYSPISGGLGTTYDGSTQYAQATDGRFSGTAFVTSLRYASTPGAIQNIMSQWYSSNNAASHRMRVTTGNKLDCTTSYPGANRSAVTTASLSTNTWHRGVSRFHGTASRYAGFDGGNFVQNTQNHSSSSFERTGLANMDGLSLFAGDLAFSQVITPIPSDDWFAYDSSMMAPGTQSSFYTAGGWTAAGASSARLLLTNAAHFGGKL